MTYMKAVEAGCDIIDTAMSPFALWVQASLQQKLWLKHSRAHQYDTGLRPEFTGRDRRLLPSNA